MDGAADRYRALQEAALAITSELSLDRVLRKIVEAAKELVQARYAALGVVQPDLKGLAQFVVSGVTDEEIAAVGHWPRGLGLLGVLLRDPRPLRVREIAKDPRSVGFPPGHPPMTSFLGVPIIAKGNVLGNFYLTDKVGAAAFTPDDEALIVALAAFAAVTIENARLYTETDAHLRRKLVELQRAEQRSQFLLDLSALLPTGPLAGELPLREVLRRAAALLGDACALYLLAKEGTITNKVIVHEIPERGEAAASLLEERWPAIVEQVLEKGRSCFVADIETCSRSPSVLTESALRAHGFSAGMLVPIRTAQGIIGVFVSLASQPLGLSEEDFLFGRLLATRLATAVENAALLSAMRETLRQRDESIAALREAEKSLSQLAAIVENSDEAIIGKTLDGVITTWNPGAERLYGYSAREAIGQPISLIVPPDRLEELAQLMARLRRGERIVHFDTVRVRKDGSPVPVSVSLSPIKDESGRIIGSSTIARDITERKRVEQLREEYVSLISHDLRGPLTGLTGHADWLRRALAKQGLAQEASAAEAILRSARRMNTMIEELVDSARLEAGRIALRKVPTDLKQLVTDTVARVAGENSARVHVQAPAPVPLVAVDPERTERAITNLLTNAMKYSPPEAPVLVRIDRQQDKAIVCVTDQGVGIPKHEQPQLFQRFHRASTAGTQEGLGLGLYITRLIAEAHEGGVSVESEVGKGSTFCLTLPV